MLRQCGRPRATQSHLPSIMPDTSITAEQVLALAAQQIGTAENPPYSNKVKYSDWYGLTGPWCAMFVSWVLHHAGYPIEISSSKGFAYCPSGVKWFKDHGRWAGRKTKPEPGWVIFFDFPNDGVNRPSHTGLVEAPLADGRVATIEGNTNGAGSRDGGSVMRHRRSVAGGIIGYGIIDYTDPGDPTEPEEPEMQVVLNLYVDPDKGAHVYSVFGNTGYYVASQEEIDELREKGVPFDDNGGKGYPVKPWAAGAGLLDGPLKNRTI